MSPASLTKSGYAGAGAHTAPLLAEADVSHSAAEEPPSRPAGRCSPRSAAEGSPLRAAAVGGACARNALHGRFADRLAVRDDFSRRLVSYQGNKTAPGLRWFKYKEGFSAELVRDALRGADGPVLDPFAGIGTTALLAAGSCRPATGVEIMPVGARAAAAISWVARQQSPEALKRAGKRLLRALDRGAEPPDDAASPMCRSRGKRSARKPRVRSAARGRSFGECATTVCGWYSTWRA